MHRLLLRIGRHFKKKWFFWILLGVSFVLATAYISLMYAQTKKQMEMYFQQVYEKKNLTQLEVFHNGLKTYLESYFENRLNFIWNIALDTEFGNALRNGDGVVELQKTLDRERRISGAFETLGVLDKNGILLATSSDYADVYRLVGENLSDRRHTQVTLQTKDASVVPMFQTLTGRQSIFFTAPIFDKAGEIEYIILASETFTHFARYLPIQSRFARFQSLLLDDRGYIVLRDGEAVSEKINVGDNDRLAERLLLGAKTAANEEINYAGEKVFAQGDKISFNTRNHLFLISYYPVNQLEMEEQQLNEKMDRYFVSLAGQFILAFGIFIVIFIILIRRYERTLCQR